MSQALQTMWEEVVAAALLGSDRRPFSPPVAAAGDRLGRVLGNLDGPDSGRALLGAAGTLSLYRRVGRLPASDSQNPPEPCPADATPACSPGAAEHLRRMLAGENREVLPEWLAALAATGRRVAEDCLVPLLEAGRNDRALWAAIEPVLGRRGQWLASLNPAWSFAEDHAAGEADWETGTKAERLAILRRLRKEAPDRGRALVESTWAEDTHEDRAAFLAAFAEGLSMADEPFLEARLDDRRKEVRSQAADLLARLPGSGLVGRMKARLIPMLAMKGQARSKLALLGGKNATLEADIPDSCDKATERDGIEPKPTAAAKVQGMGEKAWRLCQMLGAVPPSTWTETFGAPPEALVAAACRGEWKQAILKGWAAATRRHDDPDWADALLAVGTVPATKKEPRLFTPDEIQGLIEAIPPERREAIVLKLLKGPSGRLTADHPAIVLLQTFDHAWSPEFSRAILDHIRSTLGATGSASFWHLYQLIPRLGRSISPGLAIEAGKGWPTTSKDWAYWSDSVDKLVSLLQFRHEMLTELAP